jgi:hypothetical protein
MGYGPGSLSSPYASNVTGTSGWLWGTTTKGMPNVGVSPKSGCRCVAPIAWMWLMICELSGCSGADAISWFHAFAAGNIGQPPR